MVRSKSQPGKETKKNNANIPKKNIDLHSVKLQRSKRKVKKHSCFVWMIPFALLFAVASILYSYWPRKTVTQRSLPFEVLHNGLDLLRTANELSNRQQLVDLYFISQQLTRVELNSSRSLYTAFNSLLFMDDFANALVYLHLVCFSCSSQHRFILPSICL